MAELIGGALLSGFINVLFDRLATVETLDFFRGNKRLISHLLFDLNTLLFSANKLLNDAEDKQLNDHDVKTWLHDLRDLVSDADLVLDEINIESHHTRTSKFLSFVPSLVREKAKTELSEIVRRLRIVLEQASLIGLKEHCEVNRAFFERLHAPLVEEDDVWGRKSEKEAIVKILISEEISEKIAVVPIVGMGGIGKTTLAQLVYNDSEVRERFEVRLWVIVSDNFDVMRIMNTILKTIVENYRNSDDPSKVQSDLKLVLKGKKFLLVLDDVWCENYEVWDVLRSSLESGERGSKIIVTTRSEIVASKVGNFPAFDVGTICYDDCWRLFKKHVGFEGDLSPDLAGIGVEIVKKCKGLPLAVKSIAGLLRSVLSSEEWRRVLESDIWELENTNIAPALWLSYRFLPPDLKRCFAYFSRFPKDYEFDERERERVVLLWMAEGLLQDEKGKGKGKRSMEDVGKEYLNALISRSFFQRSRREESVFVIHDLLHDLAIHVSGESSLLLGRDCDEPVKVSARTRHLLYWKTARDQTVEFDFEGLSDAKLSSVLALPLSSKPLWSLGSTLSQKALDELFGTAGGRLRVLSLSGSSVVHLPDPSFYNLKHLRYLDLSRTKLEKLPDSTCSLYNLQTLLLSDCENLKAMPSNTSSLTKLRHLDIRGTPLEQMPPRIGHMTTLQTLSDFVVNETDGPKMRELGELHLLQGSLRISGLENADVSAADLTRKASLAELILSWAEGETEDSKKEREVLNDLRPNPKLKELEIDGFRGTTFPDWVGHNSFTNMVRVSLIRCRNCCLLPPLGQLPSLKSLKIEGMDRVLTIGDEFFGFSTTQPFPSLENLTIDGMESLKKWSFSSKNDTIFPSLTHLRLEFCRRLVFGLPAAQFPSLKRLRIVSCRSMETVFPAPNDGFFPSLQAVEILRCSKIESFSKTGFPCSLTRLEIHDDCESLFANRLNWGLRSLSSLRKLELSGCQKAVDSFPEEGLLPFSLTRLRIASFRSLKTLNGDGFRGLKWLQQLSISECVRLKCLPEKMLPNSLSYLCVFGCPLLTRRCQRNVGEDWDKIKHIPLIIVNRERI